VLEHQEGSSSGARVVHDHRLAPYPEGNRPQRTLASSA
jgi:hypothetical protein